jgi:hypothetical protein
MSRYYRVDQFELVSACLYNATGRWEYLFARAADLVRMPANPAYLATMQRIDAAVRPPWYRTFEEVL